MSYSTELTSPEPLLLPDETDVYSEEGAGELLDEDAINPFEHGFMIGY